MTTMKTVYRELQPNQEGEEWLFRVCPPTEVLNNQQELEETFLKSPENR